MRKVTFNPRKSKVVGTQGGSLRETKADRNWEKRERRPRDIKREKGGIGRELKGEGGAGGVRTKQGRNVIADQ